MSDFKRTPNGDIAIEGGDWVIVDRVAAVEQDVIMTLQTFLGESVYDRNAGIPYRQVIFEPGTTVEAIRFIVEQRLLALDNVSEVVSLDVDVDRRTREMTVRGTIRTSFGDDVEFSQVVA